MQCVLLGFMLTAMLQMSWSPKGYTLNGALIGVFLTLAAVAAREQTHERTEDLEPEVPDLRAAY